ncbi:MAG: hypothetical protein J07HB67_01817 [halophilic archaeon J07HB67]|jgi:hypothetical protein|nr:MAG: hypothetical protein J07HB67_01817 [halophilic archaeon J07HB67]
MYSEDSLPEEHDRATGSELTDGTSPQRLQSEYGGSINELCNIQLPDTRIRELVSLCVETQSSLDTQSKVDTKLILTLTTAAAEAVADLETATVVSEAELPDSRALETGTPVDEYVLTAAERSEALAVLSSLLFTVSETPVDHETDQSGRASG